MTTDDNTLGRRIRAARLRRGFTQTELATHAGTMRNTIASIELGRIESPGVHAVYRIAKALNVCMDTLMGEPSPFAVAADGYATLVEAQAGLEARWADAGRKPGESMTADEFDAFFPEARVNRDDVIAAAGSAIAVLESVEGLSTEWVCVSMYSAGVLARGLLTRN